ncbi:TetR family transcriptional regulator [Trinickia dabaoshanensis]|uniref:TetR family transcriptional regulator n=1 Tax=Trinickia dabaoshanensis TaxID=564714 RepID=A0A2N7VFR3_9BURK|nr:TetR/AcrR family transcriptional regulator [Trinickia dabaoshanensis]PMS15992.1 TetR family transcriptional regulator [Trinickia dabaoshanensis]
MKTATDDSPPAIRDADPKTLPGPRDRLLDAAEALIYAGGIHATGVDAIVRASQATRKSFYAYFESKDALVAAALERRHLRWMDWFEQSTRRKGNSPGGQLLGMFDVLREWFASPGFHGCAFLNASGEIASPADPIRIVAREHKAALLRFIEACFAAFAEEHGIDARQATALARQWLVLVDGAIGVALVSGAADAADDAQAAARQLLDHAASMPRPRASKAKRVST